MAERIDTATAREMVAEFDRAKLPRQNTDSVGAKFTQLLEDALRDLVEARDREVVLRALVVEACDIAEQNYNHARCGERPPYENRGRLAAIAKKAGTP